jgi:pyruvate-formate lyase
VADVNRTLDNEPRTISPRAGRLREACLHPRDHDDFRGEVMAFSTGTPWDTLFNPLSWDLTPSLLPFVSSIAGSLRASAVTVPLPADFWRRGIPMRRAILGKEVLAAHLPIAILEDELIAGAPWGAAISPGLTRDEAVQYGGAAGAWFHSLLRLHGEGVGSAWGGLGQVVPDYPRVLRLGFQGIQEAAATGALHETRPAAREFLEALSLSCEAPRLLAARYAKEAGRLADDPALSPARRGELREIARICRKVPWRPAQTFHEALQSCWLTHIAVMAFESCSGAGLSPGRIDQYLNPFYQADLRAGRLTRPAARELLESYFIKHNYISDFQGRIGANRFAGADPGQFITLGGQVRADARPTPSAPPEAGDATGPNLAGSDATTELTWVCLDILDALDLAEPGVGVRLHAGTPRALLERVVEIIADPRERPHRRPLLLSFDEGIIEALAAQGLPADRLWDYALTGCPGNALPGDAFTSSVEANLNLAKAVELALFNGRNPVTGHALGPAVGRAESFTTFEAFYGAVKVHLRSLLHQVQAVAAEADRIRSTWTPTPHLSTLIGGSVAARRDAATGGAAHGLITIRGLGLATLVDSVAAVKRLVYDEKRLRMVDLVLILADGGTETRRRLTPARAPKFGRGDPYADNIARDLSRFWTLEASARVSGATGRRFRSGYASRHSAAYGLLTGTTPDGRMRGHPLSEGVGPSKGGHLRGEAASGASAEALTLSIGALGLATASAGASHRMSLDVAGPSDPAGRASLASFLETYGRIGGTALEIAPALSPAGRRRPAPQTGEEESRS